MTNDFIVRKAYKNYLITTMMGSFVGTIGMTVDSIVIGNVLGPDALAASGVAMPVFLVLIAVGGILASGGSTCSSHYMGREETEKMNDVFSVVLVISFIVGIILMLLLWFTASPLASLMGAKGNIIPMVSAYVKGLALGSLPMILCQVLTFYTRMDGSPGIGLICVIVMTAVNITLDLLFAIVLDMGMFGMSLATTISYVAASLICCLHFFKKSNTLRFKLLKDRDRGIIAKMLYTGVPNAATRVCATARTFILNNLLPIVGITALSVQSNISNLACIVLMGVGQTLALMTGIFYGEKDNRSIEKAMKISLKSGLILSVIFGVVFIFAAPVFVKLFGIYGGEAVSLSTKAIVLYSISLPIQLINYIFINYYQSSEKTSLSNILIIMGELAMPVLCVYALKDLIGYDAIWLCISLGETLVLIIRPVIIKIKYKKFPLTLKDCLLLPKAENNEKEMTLSIENSVEKAAETSEKVMEFLKKEKIDQRTAYFTSLALEEMIKNISQYGYDDEKLHFIDIKIMIFDNGLAFRIRDDGKPFNPVKYNKANSSGADNIGIRLVCKLSKQMEYRHTLGLNNLLITVA